MRARKKIPSGQDKTGESKAPAGDTIAGKKEAEAKSALPLFAVDESASVGRKMNGGKSIGVKETVGKTGVEIEDTGDKIMTVEEEVAADSAAEKRDIIEKKIVGKEQVAGEEKVTDIDNGVKADGTCKINRVEIAALSCCSVDRNVVAVKKVDGGDDPADMNIAVDGKREGVNVEDLLCETAASPQPKYDSDVMAKHFFIYLKVWF